MKSMQYNWINDDVKIEFPIHGEVLRNAIEDCEKYDMEGDPQYFGMAKRWMCSVKCQWLTVT